MLPRAKPARSLYPATLLSLGAPLSKTVLCLALFRPASCVPSCHSAVERGYTHDLGLRPSYPPPPVPHYFIRIALPGSYQTEVDSFVYRCRFVDRPHQQLHPRQPQPA